MFRALTILVSLLAFLVPARSEASWFVETVDATLPSSGNGSALAFDAQDVPHVVYFNADPNVFGSQVLRYAVRNGSAWKFETIDGGNAQIADAKANLALDATGTPHVVYPTSSGVVYATRAGGTWTREFVSNSYAAAAFLELDGNGRPHVLYGEATGSETRLIHATRTAPGVWSTQILSSGTSAAPDGIRIDAAGRVLVLYRTGFPNVLRLFTIDGGVVTSQVVDHSFNLVAKDIRMVLDGAGTPWVSYNNYNTGTGYLATRVGGVWSITATPVEVGFAGGGDLVVKPDGTILIGYVTGEVSWPYASRLRLARRTAGTWTLDEIEHPQAPIGAPALALDSQGEPRMAYSFSTQTFFRSELHYATFDPSVNGVTRHVPGSYATIQAAINASADQDTVLVGPGIFYENLDFKGKAIVVRSEAGAPTTIIDGGALDAVVTFKTREDTRSVLDGFTLRNGKGSFDAGGVAIDQAGPVVRHNVVDGNVGGQGGGVSVRFGSPRIEDNTIRNNRGRSWGGGVAIGGYGSAQLLRNRIENNTGDYEAGGLFMNGAGTPEIRGNIIVDNHSSGRGGGILMFNTTDALIADNVIARNIAVTEGGGIHWLTPSGSRGPWVFNNTIVDNVAPVGSGIFADGYDAGALIANNVVAGVGGTGLLYSGNFNNAQNPSVHHNDVFPSSGSAYGGLFPDLTGSFGNFSTDPAFVGRAGGNYRLLAGSAVIDRGDDGIAGLGVVDVDGVARVQDGDGNGNATVDCGAYEFTRTATPPPVALAGADQTVECAPVPEGGTAVVLDGSASRGTGLTYHWTATGVRFEDASSALTTAWFPTTATIVVLEVSDGTRSDLDTVLVTVADTTPPSLEVAITPALLWPPNGRMVPIEAEVTGSDACDANVTLTLVAITSSEPGSDDVEGAAIGGADFAFSLRAERAGDGAGRFYAVTYEARDAAGNTARATVQAFVPHDQAGRAAFDGAGLTVFGAPELDVRAIAGSSVELGDPESVRFRIGAEALVYDDLDGDGQEDVRLSLRATGDPAPPSPFGLAARWFARGRTWSAVLIAPVSVPEGGPSLAFSAGVWPNPARGSSVMRVHLPDPGLIKVTLYDVRGRAVKRFVRAADGPGTFDVALDDLSSLGAALYFYRVECGARSATGRFVFTR